ncbi:MAG: amidohydrolase [Saprospiraceae bacterium]|nr:amidohydrolase [Saprospiraceae bacterium]
MQNEIKHLATQHLTEVIGWRRHLHAHPELSFQEKETAQYVAAALREMGLQPQMNFAGHGVVALIEGTNPSRKTIALRADMDALPILEDNDVPYRSKNAGVMHACGHDVHTASLLGAARILVSLKHRIKGSVKLIFQPAEEKLPGGASLMIAEGVLRSPKPVGIFGQHVHPALRAGYIGIKPGIFMASADEIYISVKGRGGHGAMPQDCVDPVLISSQIIVALQQVVSRMADPAIPSVLSFGKINSVGGATNIIPNEVKMEGTFRTMNEKWRSEAHRRMKAIAENTAKGMGGSCTVDILKGYPVLHNDPALTLRSRQWAIEYLGADKVVDLPIRMTAEDFAYYSQKMPACFYRLGTGNPERGITSPVHTSTFDIDENALLTGMGLMSWLACRELGA